MSNIEFSISFPTDNGYWGRECNICLRYFKIASDKIKDALYCPYCGELQPIDLLWTKEQNAAKKSIATAVVKRHIEDELQRMIKDVFKNSKSVNYTPSQKTPIPKQLSHVEKEVDTEIQCPDCSTKFQVYGVFGFCPGCKEDNMMIYEANLKILLKEIDNASDLNRALRHAYNDLVATFESYCKMVSQKNNLGISNFQNLRSTKEHFKKFNLNIYDNVSDLEKIKIKRIFEKRHAYQHAKGKITADYIKNIPEDNALLGTVAVLSKAEFIEGTDVLKKIFRSITSEFCS